LTGRVAFTVQFSTVKFWTVLRTQTASGMPLPGVSVVLSGTVTPGGTTTTNPLSPGDGPPPTLVLQQHNHSRHKQVSRFCS
jgi:hypothetical protein